MSAQDILDAFDPVEVDEELLNEEGIPFVYDDEDEDDD